MGKTIEGCKTTSGYDRLSPEIMGLAYDKNSLFDIEQRHIQLDREVSREEVRLEAEGQKALAVLSVEEGIRDDELICRYREIIRSSSDVRRDMYLEEMLLLRAKLIPGEVFISDDLEVETIAIRGQDGEDRQAAQPVIIRKPTDFIAWNVRRRQYNLMWSVPVKGRGEMLTVNMNNAVGIKDIEEYLDNDSIYGDMSMIELARKYRAIGRYATARRYQDEAVLEAFDELAYPAIPARSY